MKRIVLAVLCFISMMFTVAQPPQTAVTIQSEKHQPVIKGRFVEQLQHMKTILDKQNTDYHIVLSPAICYLHSSVNPADLEILENIFGKERVHDYTGKNELTEDYNNFSDPNHFGLRVGYLIMQDIYGERPIRK